eukprot:CCRYP_004566-RA/>CCRYP_004566-RA protein AED:0.08 eAED:0.08 QI:100/1/1/1/1/1/4/110/543
MTSTPTTRKRLTRIFKSRGLTLQSTALDALLNVLSRETHSPSNADDALFAIIDEIKQRMEDAAAVGSSVRTQGIVTVSLLEEVVANLSRNGKDVAEEALQLLPAYSMPRLEYDPMRRTFDLVREPKSLVGEAIDKVAMFAQRYALIHQRIVRQDIFQRGAGGTHVLTPVESLLGRSGRKFLLGMIVQVEEGKYYLEDHTGQVPLDFSQASLLTDGFVMENCIVLVEGEAVDGVLHVHHLGSPIVENRSSAIQAIGLQNTDIFNSINSLSELEKERQQEIKHGQDGMFVILSDVHLDNPSVLDKLEVMLEGYSEFTPLPVFIFMGNFMSKPLSASSDGGKAVMSYFEDLAGIICKFPKLAKEGRFVFVPGPSDPGITGVLPRGPIPNYFTGALRSKVKHAFFASNPCRMRFFTKELVFFRDDLVSKMRRHTLLQPRQEEEGSTSVQRQLSRHAVKTVLDQSHLSPLPLSASPIFWQHDHALRLYPFPDALIIGDRVDQYYENYEECDAINPGPFTAGYNFVVYRPVGEVRKSDTTSEVEFSQIE